MEINDEQIKQKSYTTKSVTLMLNAQIMNTFDIYKDFFNYLTETAVEKFI